MSCANSRSLLTERQPFLAPTLHADRQLTVAFLADPIGLGPGIASGPPDAQGSLPYALPFPRDATGAFVGMDRSRRPN